MQLQEEADASPSLYGVPGVGPPDPEVVEEDREGLPLGAPEGTVGEVTIYDLFEDTPVGSRSSGMARANVDEERSVRQESEGEEGGPGPS